MTSDSPLTGSADPIRERWVLYRIDEVRGVLADYMVTALAGLRPIGSRLIAIVDERFAHDEKTRLRELVDEVVVSADASNPAAYLEPLRRAIRDEVDEVVFTGNSWYGPAEPLEAIVDRMAPLALDAWEMTGNIDGARETFPEEGFPGDDSWLWLAVRRRALRALESLIDTDESLPEWDVVSALESAGFRSGSAFPAADYPRGDPAMFAPDLLLADGFPFLSRAVFSGYPPFLDRHAILGRELLADADARGFDIGEVYRDLVRNVPPKALNTIAGMLEVLPADGADYDQAKPFRIAVVAYVPELDFVDQLVERLQSVPSGFDLFVTTRNGALARAIEMRLAALETPPFARFETRVCWVRRGRDKAALLIACRDVILGDDYDLIVNIHGRTSARKPSNMRDYSRRHQLDNLLGGAGYTRNLLALFQREPGLGLVFPPVAHVGTTIMGRGWGPYKRPAEEIASRLDVRVPFDRLSPLAPFGGMWVGRPAAIRPLARIRWTDNDYGPKGRKRYVELGRVQERLIPLVAAEQGLHVRTVLCGEHASIAHTSLEYKADQLFATTRGYPFEQIRFMHRMGFTGHGGIVALTRMYLRVNHPRVARATLPLYRAAYRGFLVFRVLRRGLRRVISTSRRG